MFKLPFTEDSKNDEIPISTSLDINIKYIKTLYSHGLNSDFSFRAIEIKALDKQAALFYINTIVNSNEINLSIIKPLLESSNTSLDSIVNIKHINNIHDMNDVKASLNSGGAVLFVDGQTEAYEFNVADFKHRGIEKSENESVVKGPKEAFTESVMTNMSILRRQIHNENLIFETMPIGKRSNITVTISYIKNICSDAVIDNVKERLKKINVDSVRNVELLEQYIEDRPYSIVPTILYTERPDRSAAFLEDGYVVLLMENSSASLVLPVTFWAYFHSAEDHYLRCLYGNFSRVIRIIAFLITIFISAFYVSITEYHNEMIPPDLLFAIASAREKVPFPAAVEILMMEFAFELIREAGLRIPNPLGPTIGIVGALILGQAAVEANIISPIIIIIAALSGLSSFAVADISFNYSVRITKFIFIFGAAVFGIYGLTSCFLLWLIYLSSVKSFGIPFFSPSTPYYRSSKDTFFRTILQREDIRPGFVVPKDTNKKNMR